LGFKLRKEEILCCMDVQVVPVEKIRELGRSSDDMTRKELTSEWMG